MANVNDKESAICMMIIERDINIKECDNDIRKDVRLLFYKEIEWNGIDVFSKSNQEAMTWYTVHSHDGTFSTINAKSI